MPLTPLYNSLLFRQMDRLIPSAAETRPELIRRSRMQIRFGFLGALFAIVYATFYTLIDHPYGALTICGFGLTIGLSPFLLRQTGSIRLTSHLQLLALTTTFLILPMIEGGMHGHAIAWLATIPLCAIMLSLRKDAAVWVIASLLIAAFFAIAHVRGVHFPEMYPDAWRTRVEAAGYAGLVPFVALIGYSFETTRRDAFSQKNAAIAELSEANQQLQQLNEQQAEFLSIAVHDLKNPLSAIINFSELIREENAQNGEPLNPQIEQHATRISQTSDLMVNIISQCLGIDTIEGGEIELDLQRCSTSLLIEEVLAQNTALAERKRIALQWEAPTGEERAVIGDPRALAQVLDNLVSNAIKYSPRGSTVRLQVKEVGSELAIEVIDEGPGLNDHDRSKLFGKFCRLTPRPTGGETSSGLGLWISKRMSEAMMGDLYCESELDKGSTFGLRLPIWNDAMSASLS